jgi:hypothetical protein
MGCRREFVPGNVTAAGERATAMTPWCTWPWPNGAAEIGTRLGQLTTR